MKKKDIKEKKSLDDFTKDLDYFEEEVKREVDKRLSSMLGFLDENQIVTFDPKVGIIFLGPERIDESRAMNLKSESEFVLQSQLWKVFNETIRHQAYEIMFLKSTSFDDMRSGKMLLYLLDLQRKILNIFRSYKSKSDTKGLPGVV